MPLTFSSELVSDSSMLVERPSHSLAAKDVIGMWLVLAKPSESHSRTYAVLPAAPSALKADPTAPSSLKAAPACATVC